VAIKDTLSEYLNPGSIRMGLASHDYTWEIQEGNILYIVFEDIMLPDSNVNEVASHGFVKFKIDQTLENPPGTQIFNDASIYFDFNAAVVTNTTTHMIEDRLIIYDTTYTSYCDHWFYENDTIIEIFNQFDYYDLYLTNFVDIQNSQTTYLDSALIAGTMYQGVVYENDTTIVHSYSNMHGCDSLVEVSLSILSNTNELDLGTQIQLYPNPTNDDTYLIFNLEKAMKTNRIEIHNHIGQLVQSISLEREFSTGEYLVPISLEDLQRGVYLITLQGPQIQWTKRLLIE